MLTMEFENENHNKQNFTWVQGEANTVTFPQGAREGGGKLDEWAWQRHTLIQKGAGQGVLWTLKIPWIYTPPPPLRSVWIRSPHIYIQTLSIGKGRGTVLRGGETLLTLAFASCKSSHFLVDSDCSTLKMAICFSTSITLSSAFLRCMDSFSCSEEMRWNRFSNALNDRGQHTYSYQGMRVT